MLAKLALEDGTVFPGRAYGASGEETGEVVFNTTMGGYQEVLTDPSYRGQIVVMTCPHIGNVGVNAADAESERGPQAEGFVAREFSRVRSNFRSEEDLEAYFRRHGVLGLEGIDTRALTRHLRVVGSLIGVLSTQELDDQRLVEKARRAPRMEGSDFVREVTCREARDWTQGPDATWAPALRRRGDVPYRVAAVDYGVKSSLLRFLVGSGCQVRVFPATATADELLASQPEGVFLSNGPGDPAALPYAVEATRKVVERRVPVFGVCLGHQILGLALGARTYKLKFGHHGGNHPVQDVRTGRVAITAQNHGFAVDAETLAGTGLEMTHRNLNDGTLEGMRHASLPAFSVQYHPEASPGPHDSLGLFEHFVDEMQARRGV
ncbi:MAG: glutamine-hydrolyzing carbamoyl-phosphate synthase small subunit [Planctomycetes bacterium]|nr:glutamine-hydrolyzing carbamoyl-phosphate synthase small subunit [Planctomycetota bacterium]